MGTHYSHMTPADRMSIRALLQAKLSGPAIALKLGISRSTINRELNRSKARPTALATDYQAGVAQVRSQQRRRDAGAGRRKLGSDTQSPLWRTVIDGLRCRWSPQQIAGKLPDMNESASLAAQSFSPAPLSVSHETIYCAIYAMPRSTLRTELVGAAAQKLQDAVAALRWHGGQGWPAKHDQHRPASARSYCAHSSRPLGGRPDQGRE